MLEHIPEKVLDRFKAQIPVGRLGRPDEIARVVHFPASDHSSFITGAVVHVNGARRCRTGLFWAPMPNRSAQALGDIIRQQRELAELSMRQFAELAGISNPYLSQIERGLRAPSEQVIDAIARTLRLSADALYEQAGVAPPGEDGDNAVLEAIAHDPRLTARQRSALREVYEAFVGLSARGPSRRGEADVSGASSQRGEADASSGGSSGRSEADASPGGTSRRSEADASPGGSSRRSSGAGSSRKRSGSP